MADDGMLSQDDINAAFEAAGLDEPETSAKPEPAPAKATDDGELTQADIDAALAAAGDDVDVNASTTAVPNAPDARADATGKPFDEIAAAMAEAIAAESADTESASAATPSAAPSPASSASSTVAPAAKAYSASASPVAIPELSDLNISDEDAQNIDLLRDVNLDVKIELGRSRMYVEDVLRLGDGSVVELDKLAGDPVDVLVNGRLVARGEVLVLNDTFCVRINDIVSKVPIEEEAVA